MCIRDSLEARAFLHPLFRLYPSVPVQVRAEVAMSADADIVFEPFQQLRHKQTQGTALLRRACILGTPFRVQTAFIAYPDATGIVPLAMCADKLYRTGIHHLPVTTDIVVVTDASEPATTMYRFQDVYKRQGTLSGAYVSMEKL